MSYLSPGVRAQRSRQRQFEKDRARRSLADAQVVTDHVVDPPSLMETYREIYPRYLPPNHLREAVEVLERAQREPVRAIITLPRRAGKTELLIAYMVHRLRCDPTTQVTYASYGQASVNDRSDRVRKYSGKLGVPMNPRSSAKRQWKTGVEQGGLWATSTGGPLVGEGSDILLLDDLLKGRRVAESPTTRDHIFSWIKADALNTLSPTGSVILTSTRWHEDDPSGRLLKEGWQEVHVPAILDDGSSYWPDRWSLASLLRKMEDMGGPDGYDWTSLYQGRPRPSGASVFRDYAVWDSPPLREHMRVWIGVDPAYSVSQAADWQAAVVLGEAGGRCYVLDVLRCKLSQEGFARAVGELHKTWSPDGIVCYVNRTEQNIRSLFRTVGLEVSLEFTVEKKDVHARPASYWWNSGRILLPPAAAWREAFISEVVGFPGRNDDQVDCLAAAFLKLTGHALDWSGADAAQALAPKAFDPEATTPDDWDY